MRAIKVVVHGRPPVGQAVQTHLRAGNVDENDKDAVIAALNVYLRDTVSMSRIIASTPPVAADLDVSDVQTTNGRSLALAAVKPDPRKHTYNRKDGKDKPPSACFHCGEDHWANACTHADKGTNKHRIRQLKADIAKLESTASPPASTDDKLALVTAKLSELANHPPVQL